MMKVITGVMLMLAHTAFKQNYHLIVTYSVLAIISSTTPNNICGLILLKRPVN
jgi:hypothetical protein